MTDKDKRSAWEREIASAFTIAALGGRSHAAVKVSALSLAMDELHNLREIIRQQGERGGDDD